MEEILSSIRRVIARDESARTGGAPLPSPADSGADLAALIDGDEDGADDILELTETNEADMARPVTPPAAVPVAAASPADTATAAVAAATPELLSPVSAAASRQSLDALAAALSGGQDAPAAAPAPGGDVTINALVEAVLRPMLKQWLDANLPPLVERIVATEIARITGGR